LLGHLAAHQPEDRSRNPFIFHAERLHERRGREGFPSLASRESGSLATPPPTAAAPASDHSLRLCRGIRPSPPPRNLAAAPPPPRHLPRCLAPP
jgi:hypothetical protein